MHMTMHRANFVLSLILSAGLTVSPASAQVTTSPPATAIPITDIRYDQGQVFPANLDSTIAPCTELWDARRHRPTYVLGAYRRWWMNSVMAAANETSLSYYREQNTEVIRMVRFLWSGAFSRPVVIRLSETNNHVWQYQATELTSSPNSEPNRIRRQVARNLTPEEVSMVIDVIDRQSFFEHSGMNCGSGTDGSTWVMEGLDAHEYRFTRQFSPRTGPLQLFGTYLLHLTGWGIADVE